MNEANNNKNNKPDDPIYAKPTDYRPVERLAIKKGMVRTSKAMNTLITSNHLIVGLLAGEGRKWCNERIIKEPTKEQKALSYQDLVLLGGIDAVIAHWRGDIVQNADYFLATLTLREFAVLALGDAIDEDFTKDKKALLAKLSSWASITPIIIHRARDRYNREVLVAKAPVRLFLKYKEAEDLALADQSILETGGGRIFIAEPYITIALDKDYYHGVLGAHHTGDERLPFGRGYYKGNEALAPRVKRALQTSNNDASNSSAAIVTKMLSYIKEKAIGDNKTYTTDLVSFLAFTMPSVLRLRNAKEQPRKQFGEGVDSVATIAKNTYRVHDKKEVLIKLDEALLASRRLLQRNRDDGGRWAKLFCKIEVFIKSEQVKKEYKSGARYRTIKTRMIRFYLADKLEEGEGIATEGVIVDEGFAKAIAGSNKEMKAQLEQGWLWL